MVSCHLDCFFQTLLPFLLVLRLGKNKHLSELIFQKVDRRFQVDLPLTCNSTPCRGLKLKGRGGGASSDTLALCPGTAVCEQRH